MFWIVESTGKFSQDVHAKERVEVITSHLCLNDFNVERIENALLNGSFWSYYEINKSPADGHCLLHSVICGMKLQLQMNTIYDLEDVIRLIRDETLLNIDMYVSSW